MKYHASIVHLAGGAMDFADTPPPLADAVTLRGRMFPGIPTHMTSLSAFDRVSSHIVLYAVGFAGVHGVGVGRAVAAARVIHRSLCRARGLPFPVERHLTAAPAEHREAYEAFQDRERDVKQVQYLTVSAGVRRRDDRTFLLEAMHWLFATVISETGGSGLVGMINSRFKGCRWLAPLGSWPALPELSHPHSRDPHELILIKKFSAPYLTSGEARFRHLLAGAFTTDGRSHPTTCRKGIR